LNIAVFGVGGVGGYFGVKIRRAMEALQANVYFVARGSHLKAIQNDGLTVRTFSEGIISCRPALATADIEELPSIDACLNASGPKFLTELK
jgi:2-dehydropantoate 2-reductase